MSTTAERKQLISAHAWRWPHLTIYADPVEFYDDYGRLGSLPDPLPLDRHKIMIDSVEMHAFASTQLEAALAYEKTFERYSAAPAGGQQ